MTTDPNYVRSLSPEEYRRQRKLQDKSEAAAGGAPDYELIAKIKGFNPTPEQLREQERAASQR